MDVRRPRGGCKRHTRRGYGPGPRRHPGRPGGVGRLQSRARARRRRSAAAPGAANPAGRIVGGLLGATHWGWLVVEVLWVAEERRGRGCGRALLALAEGEATRRGCRQARLDTMSFQARPFYERVGYSVVGTLRDGLEGHSRYVMQKVLDLDADADEAAEGGDNVATRSPRPHASVWAWDEAGTLP